MGHVWDKKQWVGDNQSVTVGITIITGYYWNNNNNNN